MAIVPSAGAQVFGGSVVLMATINAEQAIAIQVETRCGSQKVLRWSRNDEDRKGVGRSY
jgi:hypothetical protein